MVWAFDSAWRDAAMTNTDDEDQAVTKKPGGFVELVTTPYGGNRNLAAQRGVHLLYRLSDPPRALSTVRRDSFDDALQRVYLTAIEHTRALYKFELVSSEAGSLMHLLSKHGATGATLFPGFDGVSRALWEEDQWFLS